jgi:hypothetical protein
MWMQTYVPQRQIKLERPLKLANRGRDYCHEKRGDGDDQDTCTRGHAQRSGRRVIPSSTRCRFEEVLAKIKPATGRRPVNETGTPWPTHAIEERFSAAANAIEEKMARTTECQPQFVPLHKNLIPHKGDVNIHV